MASPDLVPGVLGSIDLRLLIDSIPALIHTARPDGYLDYFNRRWLEYFNCSLEDIEGWKWTAVIHRDQEPGVVDTRLVFIHQDPKPGRAGGCKFRIENKSAKAHLFAGIFHVPAAQPTIHGVTTGAELSATGGQVGWTMIKGNLVGIREEFALADQGLVGGILVKGHVAGHPHLRAFIPRKIDGQPPVIVAGVHVKG